MAKLITQAIKSLSHGKMEDGNQSPLTQVLAMMCATPNIHSTKNGTKSVTSLVYPIRINYQVVQNYTSFVNSHFNADFGDYLFTMNICTRMKRSDQQRTLKREKPSVLLVDNNQKKE